MSLDQRFAEAMGSLIGPDFPTDIALAVSGGGDSMAMLTLAHNWMRVWGVRLWVVTVDHGLRPESADEARMVAKESAALGHPHATLRWQWDGKGNKMDAARRARLDLIDRWRGGISHVLMAHTRDDVAETFLMRLVRGSGLDGLSAMSAKRCVSVRQDGAELDMTGDRPAGERSDHFHVCRPCLAMGRDELRHYLRTLKGRWVEDPSNDDPGYDRARVRRLLHELADEGLSVSGIVDTAGRLAQERDVVKRRASRVFSEIGEAAHGIVWFDADQFTQKVEPGLQRRLMTGALRFVSGADYGPRSDALSALLDRVRGGGGGTLHGCDVVFDKARIAVTREFAAVRDLRAIVGVDRRWDGRWEVKPGQFEAAKVRALGQDGWEQAAPKAPPLPHRLALSLPSIWDEDRLIACDGLHIGPGNTVSIGEGSHTDRVIQLLLSH